MQASAMLHADKRFLVMIVTPKPCQMFCDHNGMMNACNCNCAKKTSTQCVHIAAVHTAEPPPQLLASSK